MSMTQDSTLSTDITTTVEQSASPTELSNSSAAKTSVSISTPLISALIAVIIAIFALIVYIAIQYLGSLKHAKKAKGGTLAAGESMSVVMPSQVDSSQTRTEVTAHTLIIENQHELSITGFLLVTNPEETFRRKTQIGHGGASIVYLADPLDEEIMGRLNQYQLPHSIVLKDFKNSSMSQRDIELFRQELAIMRLLNTSPYSPN
jgi:hypothetical protein